MIRNCDFKDRLKIYAIDFIFCGVGYIIVFMTITICLYLFDKIVAFEFFEKNTYYKIVDTISYVIGFYIYPIFKDLFFENGSVAKKIMKVQLIDSKTNEKPTIKKMISRNIFYITPLTIGVNLIFCRIRLDNRTLSDIITKTRVVYSKEHKKSNEFKCE